MLLKYIRRKSNLDYRLLLENFRFEQYVWYFYPNLKENHKFETVSNQLEIYHYRTDGLPKNILIIVGLINIMTCFNRRIKFYLYALHWNQKIFMYYNRYYRYLHNEKKFGKKKFLNYKHGHKLHFVACIYHRQFTGVRLDKNHARY